MCHGVANNQRKSADRNIYTTHKERRQYLMPDGMFGKLIGRTDGLTHDYSEYLRVVQNFDTKSLKYCLY